MAVKGVWIHYVPEWGRYLAERWLVQPAAAVLPRAWALRLADGVGMVESMLPIHRTRLARRELEAAGFSGAGLSKAVREHLAWPRRHIVYARRLWRGREHTREWRIRETGGEAVHRLRAQDVPLLIVSGHFVDTAGFAVNTVIFPELAGRGVAEEKPAASLSPFILRRRMETDLAHGLSRKLVEPGRESQIARVGNRGVFAGIIAQLEGRYHIAKLLADAYWEKDGAYHRPFAGIRSRGFAMGTARVARKAQCHVVTYCATFDGPTSVLVEWGTPHPPPAADDDAGDGAFMDVIIDELERMVGRHPVQYLHPIGRERAWDAATERWV